ncbi:hypothetical protein ACH5RR_036740 [Cinchona calisaya]|uniref:F-box associated beta-propeller type 3 domain-containing protein n=1 Tax=Cinchona calisaya TaxID=153742 RepID=A0ABD2Y5H7_9GENT
MQSSYLVGSCNGLLCLDAYYSIILWNPWIRKILTIPNPVVQHKLSGYRRSYRRYFFYGFGYDDATDDYKVVRLADHQSPAWCEVKVYSLKKNCWKRLPNFPYRRILGTFSITCAGILSNCALHWLVEGNNVAAIDLRTEEYRLVPKPEVLGKNYSLTLGVLDGGLCILSKFCPLEYQRSTQLRQLELQLWVMKDYGIKDSWTKLSIQVPNIDQFDNVYPIGHSKGNTELVLQKDGVVNFLWYNFENLKSVEKTIFPAAKGNSSISEGYNCVCSLVQPICGGKKGIKRKSKRKSIKWPQ